MTAPDSPRRRWFTFSLRTGFVLLTLFCVWLGVQVKWIHDRHEALHKLSARQWPVRIPEQNFRPLLRDLQQESASVFAQIEERALVNPYGMAPLSLRVFGEHGAQAIIVADNVSESDLARLARLFPEAAVVRSVRPATD